MSEDVTPQDAERPEIVSSSVGALLRASRERVGEDLRGVSESLRIRFTYLKAIEDGAYDVLPGTTYAVGFIRTYAEYLGLDGEEVVRRFRAEMSGDDGKAKLEFPTPISEGKVPSGALIMVGVVLALAAYGIWYWASSSEQDTAEVVSDVPPQMTDPAAPATEAPATPEAPTAETPATPPATDAAVVPVTPEPTPPAKPEAPAETAKKPEAPVKSPVKAPVEAPVHAVEEGAPVAPDTAVDATHPLPKPVEAPTQPEPPVQEQIEVQQPPSPPEPRVFGGENTDARIIIHAQGDSWVEVREGTTVYLSRLLHKGDTFFIPNRENLVLNTGSAGSLNMEVDGSPVPQIGKDGEVLFNIPLDPVRLREGKTREN